MVRLVEDMAEESHPAKPCLVLSNVPDVGGLKRAKKLGVPTAVVDHKEYPRDRVGFEAALQSVLVHHAPDIICLAGFMRILTANFVSNWDGRILNIHPSLLPLYPGLHTHARAIEAGDAKAGCSVHLVTPELDAGPILGQAEVPILAGDTPDHLAARVLVEEHKLYPSVLRSFVEGRNFVTN